MAGRTGLVSEDYDKHVTVIPKISSSLPLLGPALLSTPLLSPALLSAWFAQKIFDRSNVFDKAFAYRYTVTGTWTSPWWS